MKNKQSRQVIGTFSQIATLIRSITQLLYNFVDDSEDQYWQWLLLIRKFLRFITMPELSQNQLNLMNETLYKMMNTRLDLTRVSFHRTYFSHSFAETRDMVNGICLINIGALYYAVTISFSFYINYFETQMWTSNLFILFKWFS